MKIRVVRAAGSSTVDLFDERGFIIDLPVVGLDVTFRPHGMIEASMHLDTVAFQAFDVWAEGSFDLASLEALAARAGYVLVKKKS